MTDMEKIKKVLEAGGVEYYEDNDFISWPMDSNDVQFYFINGKLDEAVY